MSIKINQTKCIGCGRCTELCPTVFSLSKEGKSQVIDEKSVECALRAADDCPVEAIFVEE